MSIWCLHAPQRIEVRSCEVGDVKRANIEPRVVRDAHRVGRRPGEQRWTLVALSTAAGIGVLATGAGWMWRRCQRPTR